MSTFVRNRVPAKRRSFEIRTSTWWSRSERSPAPMPMSPRLNWPGAMRCTGTFCVPLPDPGRGSVARPHWSLCAAQDQRARLALVGRAELDVERLGNRIRTECLVLRLQWFLAFAVELAGAVTRNGSLAIHSSPSPRRRRRCSPAAAPCSRRPARICPHPAGRSPRR